MKLDFHDVWRLPFLVIKMRLKTLYIFLPSIMFDFNKKFGFCRPLGQPFEVPLSEEYFKILKEKLFNGCWCKE